MNLSLLPLFVSKLFGCPFAWDKEHHMRWATEKHLSFNILPSRNLVWWSGQWAGHRMELSIPPGLKAPCGVFLSSLHFPGVLSVMKASGAFVSSLITWESCRVWALCRPPFWEESSFIFMTLMEKQDLITANPARFTYRAAFGAEWCCAVTVAFAQQCPAPPHPIQVTLNQGFLWSKSSDSHARETQEQVRGESGYRSGHLW